MSEVAMSAPEPRIGLNSLRDFYFDHWQGKTVNGVKEADKYISELVSNLTEEGVLKKLKTGDVYVTFVKMFSIGQTIQSDYEHLKEISFRIIPVELDLGLIYFYVNRDKGFIKSSFITAELDGMNLLLKNNDFSKMYARSWMECRIPDRVMCINEVNHVLSEPKLIEAFLSYSNHFNRKDYENWRDEFQITLKIRKGHRYLISRIIKSVMFISTRRANKKREG